MILVDTSVWIAYLRDDDTPGTALLQRLLDRDVPIALSSVIALELLRGTSGGEAFDRLERYLSTQRRVEPIDAWSSAVSAARLYARCRAAGVTVRSTLDCLIAQTAIEHDLVLLHADKNFERIASVAPELKTY